MMHGSHVTYNSHLHTGNVSIQWRADMRLVTHWNIPGLLALTSRECGSYLRNSLLIKY